MQKFKRTAGIFCYVLGGFLIVFYLVTLWQGLHPSPSVEYRMYYLDQQLAFWPGENGLAIEPDSVLSFGPDCGPGPGKFFCRAERTRWTFSAPCRTADCSP